MKLIQVRHAYECTFAEAKKMVLEKYPSAAIDHTEDYWKNRGVYKDDVVWAKNEKDLEDRRNNFAIAIFKKNLVVIDHNEVMIHDGSEGILELYEIYEKKEEI